MNYFVIWRVWDLGLSVLIASEELCAIFRHCMNKKMDWTHDSQMGVYEWILQYYGFPADKLGMIDFAVVWVCMSAQM